MLKGDRRQKTEDRGQAWLPVFLRRGRRLGFRKAALSRGSAVGFTLVEMLVTLGIFSVFLSTATEIYLATNRTQRRTLSADRAQADARFAMEAMAREFRSGVVDYDYYASRGTPLGTPDEELALVSSDETRIRFLRSSSANDSHCPDEQSRPCLLVVIDGTQVDPITPKGVKVNTLKFYVAPSVDPFAFVPGVGYESDVQPTVTIVLSLQTHGGRANEQATFNIQTTATSRAYRR